MNQPFASRSTWTDKPLPGYPLRTPVGLWVIHHFWKPDVPADATPEKERQIMRAVDADHRSKGWGGIGYQFVVFDSGRGYEGRGPTRTGAHTVGQNSGSLAIAFANDGDTAPPTDAAWATAANVIAWCEEKGYAQPGANITGHRNYAKKSCPGDKTYPLLSRLRADPGDGDMTPTEHAMLEGVFNGVRGQNETLFPRVIQLLEEIKLALQQRAGGG